MLSVEWRTCVTVSRSDAIIVRQAGQQAARHRAAHRARPGCRARRRSSRRSAVRRVAADLAQHAAVDREADAADDQQQRAPRWPGSRAARRAPRRRRRPCRRPSRRPSPSPGTRVDVLQLRHRLASCRGAGTSSVDEARCRPGWRWRAVDQRVDDVDAVGVLAPCRSCGWPTHSGLNGCITPTPSVVEDVEVVGLAVGAAEAGAAQRVHRRPSAPPRRSSRPSRPWPRTRRRCCAADCTAITRPALRPSMIWSRSVHAAPAVSSAMPAMATPASRAILFLKVRELREAERRCMGLSRVGVRRRCVRVRRAGMRRAATLRTVEARAGRLPKPEKTARTARQFAQGEPLRPCWRKPGRVGEAVVVGLHVRQGGPLDRRHEPAVDRQAQHDVGQRERRRRRRSRRLARAGVEDAPCAGSSGGAGGDAPARPGAPGCLRTRPMNA